MQLTLKDIMDLKPCYTDRQIQYLSDGREFITPTEIAELDIPFDDRLWVLTELMTYDQARVYARRVAASVLHLWDAPDVVRQWLTTGDPELREATAAEAARAARWVAVRAARERAVRAARAARERAAEEAIWAAAGAAGEAGEAAWAGAMGTYLKWAAEELEKCN